MKIFFAALIALLCINANAQSLAKKMFEASAVTCNSNVGVLVVDVKTGKTIDSYRAGNMLPTASTMKVISTCTALELLGADYRWSTYFETDGEIVDNTLVGNLYVRGTGDPTLGSSRFGGIAVLAEWAERLNEQGIRSIQGRVIADMSAFHPGDAMNEGWTFGDMGNYYGMGIFGLNWRDNTMRITLSSGEVAETAEYLGSEPYDPRLHFTSYAICVANDEDNGYAHGVAFNYERTITGEIPAGQGTFSINGDLPNPGLTLAEELTAELGNKGISVAGTPDFTLSLPSDKPRKLIFEHKSPALSEVVRETNIHSDNLYAESIFRTLALRDGRSASTDESRDVVERCWTSRGVNFSPIIQVDGCGLAPQNGVSPATFVSLLRYMYKSPNYGVFRESLPVSGQSGTISSFLRGTALDGKVHAKSGTIAHLRSYCGYIELDKNTVWAFSIVVNNGNGSSLAVRKEMERYLLKLTEKK